MNEALSHKILTTEPNADWEGPITLHSDNQRAIFLRKEEYSNESSKDIYVKYHFTRDHVTKANVAFEYVLIAEMIVDTMATALLPPSTEGLPKVWDLIRRMVKVQEER